MPWVKMIPHIYLRVSLHGLRRFRNKFSCNLTTHFRLTAHQSEKHEQTHFSEELSPRIILQKIAQNFFPCHCIVRIEVSWNGFLICLAKFTLVRERFVPAIFISEFFFAKNHIKYFCIDNICRLIESWLSPGNELSDFFNVKKIWIREDIIKSLKYTQATFWETDAWN